MQSSTTSRVVHVFKDDADTQMREEVDVRESAHADPWRGIESQMCGQAADKPLYWPRAAT